MACATIHLAIAKKYLEKHKNFNYRDVISGTLYPDDAINQEESHYTDLTRGDDVISHVNGKVNLYAFLQDHKSLNDYELGWFLHLVTDYLFFQECFPKSYLLKISYEEFKNDLYYAYKHLNSYLEQNYNITSDDYIDHPNQYYSGVNYEECILPIDLVNNFINRVSSIDINAYIKKIEKFKKNVKP